MQPSLPQLVNTVMRRQRRIFLAVLMAGVVGAGLAILLLPNQYTATATLSVGENRPVSPDANTVQLDEVLAQTYATLLDTPSVSGEVRRVLPFPIGARKLHDKVDFEVVTGTRLIEITASDGDSKRAQTLANTYAQTFVRNQQRSAVNASRASLDEINSRIARLVRERDQLRRSPTRNASVEREQVENQLSAAQAAYRVTEENISLQGSNVATASLASLPSAPSSPRPKLYLLLAVVFAFVLAVAAALLRDSFDWRLRDEDELVELLGVPVLARVPRLVRGREQAFTESFDFLRLNLQLRGDPGGARVVAVTSALPGDGKSRVVVNVCRALTLSGSNVVAVDCDLRKPMLGAYLGVDSNEGVTTVIVGKREATELLRTSPEGGVRVLPSGPIPPNPSVLVSTSAFRRMLARLREETSYVVVDTPPVAGGADTSAITAAVDGVVFVVDLDQARRDVLTAAKDQLDRAGAELLGLVVNRIREGSDAYYGYGYIGAGGTASGRDANGADEYARSRRRATA